MAQSSVFSMELQNDYGVLALITTIASLLGLIYLSRQRRLQAEERVQKVSTSTPEPSTSELLHPESANSAKPDSTKTAAPRPPKFWRAVGDTREELEAPLREFYGKQDNASGRQRSLLDFVREEDDSWYAIITSTIEPNVEGVVCKEDFLGITPLFVPDEASVDVVALSGLGGHPLGSFRSSDGWKVWLRDFLRKDIPKARVLVYGYDTRLAGSKSKSSIGDLAKSFLDSLGVFRKRTKTSHRPIVFIGHSLGGLVVKEAIAKARDSSGGESNNIYRSTYGLVFLGVPNLGLRHEQLLTVVDGQPNEGLIRDLITDKDSEPSAYLRELTDKFVKASIEQKAEFEIVSYYETQESATIEIKDGAPTRNGPSTMMVTKVSAERVGHRVRDDKHIPLATDHRGLVRFEQRPDEKYLSVMDKIHDLVEEAPRVVQGRFRNFEDLMPQQKRAWNAMNRPPYSKIRNSDKLAKPEMGTLQWLVAPSNGATTKDSALSSVDFLAWRDSEISGCLLVTAPPGRGKSVLSNFVVEHMEKALQSGAGNGPASIVLYYFCTIRNEARDRTAEAILRALIVQLCERQRSLYECLPQDFERDSEKFLSAPFSVLWDLFDQCMLSSRVYQDVYCVIDGLDVYSNGMVELVHHLTGAFGSKGATDRPVMKLFCTSRPHGDILNGWGHYPTRELRANPDDLSVFIRGSIERLPRKFDNHMRQAILDELQRRAGRTFLWITIVVRRLARMAYLSIPKIKQEINASSVELHELYEPLVAEALERHKENAYILAWVVYAMEPLTVAALSEAISVSPQASTNQHVQIEDVVGTLTEEDIRVELGVLLDIVDNRVFVIHQSLEDFLKEHDPFSHKRDLSLPPKRFIAYSCMDYLLLHGCSRADEDSNESDLDESYSDESEIDELTKSSKESDNGAFFRYAADWWYIHVENAEIARGRLNVLERLFSDKATGQLAWMRQNSSLKYCFTKPCTLVDITLETDTAWLMELVLEGDLATKVEDLDETTLDMAIEHGASGYYRVLKTMLRHPQGRNFRVTEARIREIIHGNSGEAYQVMELLFCERASEVHITSGILEAAASVDWFLKPPDKRVMQLLLDKRGHEIKVTAGVVEAAAAISCSGVMELLLDRRGGEVEITPEVVAAVARSSSDVMELLLDRRGSEVKITAGVVKAAASGYGSATAVIQLLLDRRRNEVKVTPEVIEAALGHPVEAEELVQLLLDKCGAEVQITPGVVKAAAGNISRERGKKAMQLLFDRSRNNFQVTPAITEAAARGTKILGLLLDRYGNDVQITPRVVEIAAESSMESLALLLDRRGSEVQTADAAKGAVRRLGVHGKGSIQLLFDQRRDEMQRLMDEHGDEGLEVDAWEGKGRATLRSLIQYVLNGAPIQWIHKDSVGSGQIQERFETTGGRD